MPFKNPYGLMKHRRCWRCDRPMNHHHPECPFNPANQRAKSRAAWTEPVAKVETTEEVVQITEVTKVGVRYAVSVKGTIVWEDFVRFGHQREHRAAGPAFQRAAQKQEHIAREAREKL